MIGNQVVGQGSYAVVKVGFHIPSQLEVAVKIYEKSKLQDSSKRQAIKNEINILNNLDHPGIIKFYQKIEDLDKVYLIMEYGGSSNLKDFLLKQKEPLSMPEVKIIFKKILEAVRYMHSKNVVHRDLKLHNIVLNSIFCPKVVDFGFAKYGVSTHTQDRCGTPNYMSPEMVINSKKCEPIHSDMWALGIILYYLAVGTHPFRGKLS